MFQIMLKEPPIGGSFFAKSAPTFRSLNYVNRMIFFVSARVPYIVFFIISGTISYGSGKKTTIQEVFFVFSRFCGIFLLPKNAVPKQGFSR